jgi:hypothetical protein
MGELKKSSTLDKFCYQIPVDDPQMKSPKRGWFKQIFGQSDSANAKSLFNSKRSIPVINKNEL